PARTEEIALPAVETSAETEVAFIEEGQPVSHEACRKAEPDGELPPLAGPAVEQTAETLRPSVPQIGLRAYFISEHRRSFAIPGDADSDWREAKQRLLSESGEIAPALAAAPMPPKAA